MDDDKITFPIDIIIAIHYQIARSPPQTRSCKVKRLACKTHYDPIINMFKKIDILKNNLSIWSVPFYIIYGADTDEAEGLTLYQIENCNDCNILVEETTAENEKNDYIKLANQC